MSESKFPILSAKEVWESITNIQTWTHTHGQHSLICAEDLAVAVPGECLFTNLMEENEEAHREIEKGILVYTDAREDQFVWLRSDWRSLDKLLKITYPNREGWQLTCSLGERLLVLILTQLDYRVRESEGEVPYGCCPLGDPTYLLWVNNRIGGMASIKRKGGSIWGGEEVYACDTLDTLYVRSCYRRNGHTLKLLTCLTACLPAGEHLALSHPVSLSMCKVLLKFVQVRPELRDNLWTLDEDGEVSGTVMLMLGSLMLKEAICTPSTSHSQSTIPQVKSASTSEIYNKNINSNFSRLTSDPMSSPMKSFSSLPSPIFSVADQSIRTLLSSPGGSNREESGTVGEAEKDEPCDTS